MLEPVLTVLAVVLGVAAVAVALVTWRALRATRVARRRLRELGGQREVAVLLALASAGRDAEPVVGTLVRTDQAVAFVPATSGTEVLVDRADITRVSITQSFMGRRFAEPVLLLAWERLGLGDAAVLRVKAPGSWVEVLEG